MIPMRAIVEFLKEENGAITLDWFALTLGTIMLCFGVTTAIADGQARVAKWIGQQLEIVSAE